MHNFIKVCITLNLWILPPARLESLIVLVVAEFFLRSIKFRHIHVTLLVKVALVRLIVLLKSRWCHFKWLTLAKWCLNNILILLITRIRLSTVRNLWRTIVPRLKVIWSPRTLLIILVSMVWVPAWTASIQIWWWRSWWITFTTYIRLIERLSLWGSIILVFSAWRSSLTILVAILAIRRIRLKIIMFARPWLIITRGVVILSTSIVITAMVSCLWTILNACLSVIPLIYRGSWWDRGG